MEWGSGDLADVAKNNFYYYISQMIVDNGPTVALIFLGLFLMVMTLFKTGCYFCFFSRDDSIAYRSGT